ncbi:MULTISPECIES: SIS domain-containing protein [Micromonospora]|uniref:D-sedoheptulose-7-phosphate isomerase n=1 Tax=Micromonospora TaxID=1873 RepID=UPI000B5AEAA2|nr:MULTISPECIES: SIS domain-containing protein [Micromonospora]MBQ0977053.1 SIS domain-containing protein [Micromonospora sp. M61]MBQ1037780.1 SIS domain-containing protein [Micromonospora sp. C81]WSK52248.1 SIS domain-containing protein [Micromonospora zamorensis]WTI24622.1 SIS domain-containing protein [Micromonospora zamorensis]
MMPAGSLLDTHLTNLAAALVSYRRCESQLARWGADLAHRLAGGGRLLVAGNGGSAAEAQHLTAELVGKLHHDRQPLSAIALHAETSALTAIANDYGYTDVYARQVRAHGRPGDVLLLLSTSGSSANLITAALAAREAGLTSWALTGATPNPLADACDEVLAVASPDTQVVQELHLVTSHLLCEYLEQELPAALAAVADPAAVHHDPTEPAPPARSVRTGVEVVLDGGTGQQVDA